jgi:LPS export ABC transporter permease LptG
MRLADNTRAGYHAQARPGARRRQEAASVFGKLDRYLARSFIEPFLLTALIITGLYVVADAFSHVDDYLRQASSILEALSRIGQIYALRIPTFLAPVMPVATLIGAAFGMSQLTAQNEINAMRASGLSYWRILSPIYVMAALAALIAVGNRELVVPRVEQIAAPEIRVWTGTEKQSHEDEQVVDEIEKEQTLFTLFYDADNRRVTKLHVVQTLPENKTIIFTAERAEPVRDGWVLYDVKGDGPAVRDHFWRTRLKPRDLETTLLPLDVRPLSVLHSQIAHPASPDPKRMANLRLFYAARLTYPFTGLVLIALGVPFVIGNEKIRRSRMLGIGICVLICIVFYTVQHISWDLGQQGRLPPEIAAWLPVVLFGAVGLYLLEALHS